MWPTGRLLSRISAPQTSGVASTSGLSMPERLFTLEQWSHMTRQSQSRWGVWRAAHPALEWIPLARAIVDRGYHFPPTEAETKILWPLVEARPNDAAQWFADLARPQGILRMQPSWSTVLRGLAIRWDEIRDGIPEDDDDWRDAREGEAEARETLKRIGWYR
jgi:hypothetical protein